MYLTRSFRALGSAALFLALVLQFATPAIAQSSGVVRGNVTDGTGAAIVGAAVTLEGPATRYSQATETDTQGGYRFYNVPFGEYTLGVKAAGFAPSTAPVAIRTGQPMEVPVSLT